MTPKEAIIRKELEKLTDTHYEPQRTEDIDSAMEVIKQVLTSPPTADEVCKALSDFYEVNIIHEHYQKGIDVNVYTIDAFYYRETNHDIDNKPYTRRRDVVAGDKERIALDVYLPPHLITMIGRFYEGLEVKE